jgi:hypothetical protein
MAKLTPKWSPLSSPNLCTERAGIYLVAQGTLLRERAVVFL